MFVTETSKQSRPFHSLVHMVGETSSINARFLMYLVLLSWALICSVCSRLKICIQWCFNDIFLFLDECSLITP